MTPYNVAYIFTPIEFGGAERVSLTFLQNVDRAKYRFSLIALVRPWEPDSPLLQELRKQNYPIHRVPVAKRPRSEGRDCFRFIRCLRIIHGLLRRGSFDLAHTHGYFADIIGIAAAGLLGIPRIATCHGFIQNDLNLRVYNRLDLIALRFADRIISVSRDIREHLVRSGLNGTDIAVVPNAVNAPAAAPPQQRTEQRRRLGLEDTDFCAGFAGRLSEEKGVRYLLEAAGRLRRRLPLKVVLIGEGPQRSALEEFAGKQGLEGTVLFAGFRSDVHELLPALDLFVLPSLTEGTPMALLEAMALGLPVVASAVGGVPQVVETERNGILVPPGDAGALENAVALLYSDSAFRTRLGQEAQQTVRAGYGLGDWLRKLDAEYMRVLAGRRDPETIAAERA